MSIMTCLPSSRPRPNSLPVGLSRPAAGEKLNGHARHRAPLYDNSSMLSSDLESTSFFDSEDDGSSRITSTTGTSGDRCLTRERGGGGTYSGGSGWDGSTSLFLNVS